MADDADRQRGVFERSFPHIAEWVSGGGYVEIGYTDYYVRAFVRALDEGGVIYEGRTEYASIDEALCDLDAGIAVWCAENRPGRP
jgi:hypothetical protein